MRDEQVLKCGGPVPPQVRAEKGMGCVASVCLPSSVLAQSIWSGNEPLPSPALIILPARVTVTACRVGQRHGAIIPTGEDTHIRTHTAGYSREQSDYCPEMPPPPHPPVSMATLYFHPQFKCLSL